MAIGSFAKSMLGFADEFMEGAAKGIGDSGVIKASVNRMKSNMTKKQAKILKNLGSTAGDSAKAVSKSQAYFKNTKNAAVNTLNSMGQNKMANQVANMKGMRMGNAKKSLNKAIGPANRVAGISDPTFANRLGDAMVGGIKDTVTGVKSGRGIANSLGDAFKDGDKLRMDRVAGTFVAASAAGRIATGGGLYKDRNGSTNIIGIPFI